MSIYMYIYTTQFHQNNLYGAYMLLNKLCLSFLFTHFLKSTLIHTIRNRFVSGFSDSLCESHDTAKIQGRKRFFTRFVLWEGETISFRTIRIVNRKILTTNSFSISNMITRISTHYILSLHMP